MSQDVAGRPSLEAFRRGYLVSNEQFNRHNFESAFMASMTKSSGTLR